MGLAPDDTRAGRDLNFLEWFGLLVGSYVVALVAGAAVTGRTEPGGPTPPRVILASAFALPACFLGVALWYLFRRSPQRPEEVLQTEGRSIPRDVFLGVGVGLAAQVVIGLVYTLFHIRIEQQIGEDLKKIVGLQLAVLVVSVALLAPLAEELMFRVLLFRSLRRNLPMWGALLLQGAIFGLVHVTPAAALPALAVAGIFFGFLYARGRSAWACVAAHMAFNSLAVADLLRGR